MGVYVPGNSVGGSVKARRLASGLDWPHIFAWIGDVCGTLLPPPHRWSESGELTLAGAAALGTTWIPTPVRKFADWWVGETTTLLSACDGWQHLVSLWFEIPIRRSDGHNADQLIFPLLVLR